MIERYYMCLAENGNVPPRKRHASPDDAKKEAERLARTLGGKVHVLASVATVEKTDVHWERHRPNNTDDGDDIPF